MLSPEDAVTAPPENEGALRAEPPLLARGCGVVLGLFPFVLFLAKCHLASQCPRNCSLLKTVPEFDLWSRANVMPVIKGQYLAAPKDRIVISFKDPAFRGGLQAVQGGKGFGNA